MKHLFIFTISLIFFNSCSKKRIEPASENLLIGNWELIMTCGGYTGECYAPSNGETRELSITETEYITFVNQNLKYTFNYSIQMDTSVYNHEPYEMIVFANTDYFEPNLIFSFQADTLTLSTNSSCAPTYTYVRKKKNVSIEKL